MPAYKNTLRYKHMVARLEKLPFYKLETAVLGEIAKGRRWRIEAAIEALSKHEDRFNYVNYMGLIEACGRFGRLTAIHRLADVYQWEKKKREHEPSPHGAPEAFDMAVIHGHYRVAEFCRRYGARPDIMIHRDRNPRAMAIAIEHRDYRKMDYLLSHGASAQYHFSYALSKRDADLIEFFIARGADVNKPTGYSQNMPLAVVLPYRDVAVVELMLKNGADISLLNENDVYTVMRDKKDRHLFDLLVDSGVAVTERSMQVAMQDGMIAHAEKLLEKGVKLGSQSLVSAVLGGHQSAIDFCLERGADPAMAKKQYEAENAYRSSYSSDYKKSLAAFEKLVASTPPATTPKPPRP